MPQAQVIALFGPTGVGKTGLAIAVAQRLRGEGQRPVAVSADALQVYRGLETLTGAADAHEQSLLEHRLISFLPVDSQFSAGQYAELAHNEIDQLIAEGNLPIVVGGTGLYLRAALAELSMKPPPAPGIREHWTAELQAHGPEALHSELGIRAPWAAAEIVPTDSQRIVRALELYDAGELSQQPQQSELWTETTRHPTLLVGVVAERERLYEQINARVDAMLAAGAEDEVRRAHSSGASITARKALGFEQLLAGDVEAMKRKTRNYARRQLTWMRKLPGVVEVDLSELGTDTAADRIVERWQRGA
jgi:tRNA dimethylallyltransferase